MGSIFFYRIIILIEKFNIKKREIFYWFFIFEYVYLDFGFILLVRFIDCFFLIWKESLDVFIYVRLFSIKIEWIVNGENVVNRKKNRKVFKKFIFVI